MKKNILKLTALALLAVMMCAMLVACGAPNKDPDKAAEKLEDAGYSVVYNDGEGLIGGAMLPDDVDATILARNGDEYIYITYYEDSKAANDAWDDVKEEVEQFKEENSDIVCKKSGKIIYYGTKQAVKDAR